jgi:Putative Actinobacterial Holin-X, holin superfamily III
MTDTHDSSQAGFADAVQDLSEQTRQLVRREIASALRETAGKARQSIPAAALLASAAVLGAFTVASSYRLSLRLLERWLSPAAAATVATAGYGTGAACAAMAAVQQMRHLPLPFPAETTREASEALATATAQAGSGAQAS